MLYDRATISGSARITKDGYFVADALVARANNIQDYGHAEIGQPAKADGTRYRIFRPEAEVFAKDALASLAHRPVTLDHPTDPVTSTNWKRLAVGDVGDEIVRDGEFVRVPIKIMDANAIDSLKSDRREFSLGYTAVIDMTPGEFEGQVYDGRATGFRYNHLAAVARARGGESLRIIDERPTLEKSMNKITIGDAKDVDLSDGAAVALAVGALNTSLADAQKAVGTLTVDLATATTAIQTKDGEIAALTQKLADAEVTPAKLQALADARAAVIGKAKAIAPNIVTDGKTDAEIRKEAVTAKLGDAAKDMADAAIEGAFVAFTKDTKVDDQAVQPLGAPLATTDAKDSTDARAAMIADMLKPATAAA